MRRRCSANRRRKPRLRNKQNESAEAVAIKNNREVYRDDRYVLGWKDGVPFLEIGGEAYKLTCHPYEPCLYITDRDGGLTAVHNAFDPSSVLEAFSEGRIVASITGTEYDAQDFCRMVEYAAGMYDIPIDEAEKVFRGRAKKKNPAPKKQRENPIVHDGNSPRPEFGRIIENDPFYDLIAAYPDCMIDYCLVKNEHTESGFSAHWNALLWACRQLFVDEEDETIWHFDLGKADAKPIDAQALFAPVDPNGKLNYRKAFLCPPYPNHCTNADFDRVNAALFPSGTDVLEVFEWTTDWSEYFDEGREWWGTLCLTVYDKALDRFIVILASATD